MANEILLLEGWSPDNCLEFNLNEAKSDNGQLHFRGKLQEADRENKNKRKYSKQILDENVQRLAEAVKYRSLVGELDHAADSIIHFKDASHVFTKLYFEGSVLYGEGMVLNTACGRILRALLNDGVRVGMSSRGVGSGKVDENGTLIISDNYRLITFDAVADPSTFDAYQEKIIGSKRENTIPEKTFNYSEKNTSSCITKEAVIAAFGSIVNENTNKIKKGIRK